MIIPLSSGEAFLSLLAGLRPVTRYATAGLLFKVIPMNNCLPG
jgi:hypothetical protein